MVSTPGALLYPANLDDLDALVRLANNVAATTVSDNPLTSGATTVNVVATTGFPASGLLSIENEIISYTGTTGTSFTGCGRGAESTTAAAHTLGKNVQHFITARAHNILAEAMVQVETKLGSATSTPAAATFLKGTGAGTSAWSALTLAELNAILATGTVGVGSAATNSIGLIVAPTLTTGAFMAGVSSNPTMTSQAAGSMAAIKGNASVTLVNSATTAELAIFKAVDMGGGYTNATAAVLTNLYGLYLPAQTLGGATGITVTTAYGVRADLPTAGGTNWAGWFDGATRINGVLTTGSGPTTLTDAAGKVLSAALNTVAVGQGGSGQTSYTDGQLLIGNTTGNTLAKGTIAGQAGGLTVTNGNGTIALALVALDTIITSLAPAASALTLTGAAPTANTPTGVTLNGTTTGNGTNPVINGLNIAPTVATTTATTGSMRGSLLDLTLNLGTSLAITNAVSLSLNAVTTTGTTTSTLTNLRMLNIAGQGTLANTTTTTLVGLEIGAMTGGATNNYGVRIAAPSGGATNRALDIASGAFYVDASGNVVSTGTLAITGTSTQTGNVGIGGAALTNVGLDITSAIGVTAFGFGMDLAPVFTTQNSEAVVVQRMLPTLTLAATTATTIVGLQVQSFSGTASSGATSTTFRGIEIVGQAAITNWTPTDSWSLFVNVPGTGTNKAVAMLKGGSVGIGTITSDRPTATLHVGQVATGTISEQVVGIAGSTVDLAKWDASAITNAQVVHIDKNGHLSITQAAIPTTGSLGTGVTSATVLASVSNDQWGMITFVTTASLVASSTVCVLTFRNAFAAAPVTACLIPANSATWGLAGTAQFTVPSASIATTTLTVKAGTTIPAAGTYIYYYLAF